MLYLHDVPFDLFLKYYLNNENDSDAISTNARYQPIYSESYSNLLYSYTYQYSFVNDTNEIESIYFKINKLNINLDLSSLNKFIFHNIENKSEITSNCVLLSEIGDASTISQENILLYKFKIQNEITKAFSNITVFPYFGIINDKYYPFITKENNTFKSNLLYSLTNEDDSFTNEELPGIIDTTVINTDLTTQEKYYSVLNENSEEIGRIYILEPLYTEKISYENNETYYHFLDRYTNTEKKFKENELPLSPLMKYHNYMRQYKNKIDDFSLNDNTLYYYDYNTYFTIGYSTSIFSEINNLKETNILSEDTSLKNSYINNIKNLSNTIIENDSTNILNQKISNLKFKNNSSNRSVNNEVNITFLESDQKINNTSYSDLLYNNNFIVKPNAVENNKLNKTYYILFDSRNIKDYYDADISIRNIIDSILSNSIPKTYTDKTILETLMLFLNNEILLKNDYPNFNSYYFFKKDNIAYYIYVNGETFTIGKFNTFLENIIDYFINYATSNFTLTNFTTNKALSNVNSKNVVTNNITKYNIMYYSGLTNINISNSNINTTIKDEIISTDVKYNELKDLFKKYYLYNNMVLTYGSEVSSVTFFNKLKKEIVNNLNNIFSSSSEIFNATAITDVTQMYLYIESVSNNLQHLLTNTELENDGTQYYDYDSDANIFGFIPASSLSLSSIVSKIDTPIISYNEVSVPILKNNEPAIENQVLNENVFHKLFNYKQFSLNAQEINYLIKKDNLLQYKTKTNTNEKVSQVIKSSLTATLYPEKYNDLNNIKNQFIEMYSFYLFSNNNDENFYKDDYIKNFKPKINYKFNEMLGSNISSNYHMKYTFLNDNNIDKNIFLTALELMKEKEGY